MKLYRVKYDRIGRSTSETTFFTIHMALKPGQLHHDAVLAHEIWHTRQFHTMAFLTVAAAVGAYFVEPWLALAPLVAFGAAVLSPYTERRREAAGYAEAARTSKRSYWVREGASHMAEKQGLGNYSSNVDLIERFVKSKRLM